MNNTLITDMALRIDMPLTISLGAALSRNDEIPNNALIDSNGFYLLDNDGYWLTSTESV